jgi:hypothetical protein
MGLTIAYPQTNGEDDFDIFDCAVLRTVRI